MNKATVHFLGHSGVAVRTASHLLVFDYYLDDTPGRRRIEEGIISGRDFGQDEQGIVLVSHSHADHFNPVIFKWRETSPNIEYVLSSDVREQDGARYISEGGELDAGGAHIKAYGSTDQGVSFLVEVDGLRIFHAGDFNLWHWQEESTKREIAEAKRAFLKIMNDLAPEEGKLDIAFFPVDTRLGRGHDAGAAFFVNKLKPSLTVPIHFGDRFDAAEAFDARGDMGQVFAPARRGDSYEFTKGE